jgi:hypothetical protein
LFREGREVAIIAVLADRGTNSKTKNVEVAIIAVLADRGKNSKTKNVFFLF